MLLSYGNVTVDNSWFVDTVNAEGFFRIYHIESGNILYKSDNEEIVLKENQLYILPNTIRYKMRLPKNSTMSTLYLHTTSTDIVSSNIIAADIAAMPDVMQTIKLFRLLIKTDKLKNNIELQNSLCDTMMNLLVSYNLFQKIDEKISQSINYMSQNLSGEIKIGAIAEQCGYHPKYYIKLFSDIMGVTPYQYLINSRMKVAFSLLVHGEKVANVAKKVGYPETKNFTRMFKEKFGVLPSKINEYIDNPQ